MTIHDETPDLDREVHEDENEDYVLLGDASELTRNGQATVTEGGRGHG